MHTYGGRHRAASALAVAILVGAVVTGCSKSGGSDDASKPSKTKTESTTTEAEETTTTEAEAEHPSDGLHDALDAFISASTTAVDARTAAQQSQDLDAAKTAIASLRTAYFEFDKDLRDLSVSGDDAEKVNDLLLVDGDVIANLDEYNDVESGDDYNGILYREVASINEWRRQVTELTDEWGVDYSGEPLSLQDGYVGAGDRIHSLQTVPGSYSFEVPNGFAGEDDNTTIDVRGPKGVYIHTGIANTDDEDAKPSDASELEDFAKEYASNVADKAEGELSDSKATEANGMSAWTFTVTASDYVERDVLILDEDTGTVFDISLDADTQDGIDRFESSFDDLLDTFEVAS